MVRVLLFMVEASGRRLGAPSELSVSSMCVCAAASGTRRIHRVLEDPPQPSPAHSSHAHRRGPFGASGRTGGGRGPPRTPPAGAGRERASPPQPRGGAREPPSAPPPPPQP